MTTLAGPADPVCTARFIVETLPDPVQDARQNCARLLDHPGRHRNADGDLDWHKDYSVSIVEVLGQEKAELRAEIDALLANDQQLDVTQRGKVNMHFLGTLDGMHQHLDQLRDPGEQVPTDGLAHNIEQAQINLEVASMRLMQVHTILVDRLKDDAKKETPSADQ